MLEAAREATIGCTLEILIVIFLSLGVLVAGFVWFFAKNAIKHAWQTFLAALRGATGGKNGVTLGTPGRRSWRR
jgi:hypothetical protein